MTISTKLFHAALFLLISKGTVIAMEESKYTLMINDKSRTARYCTTEFHSKLVPSNLPSTIKDPLIECFIQNTETKEKLSILLAVKYLLKPETLLKIKSELQIKKHHHNLDIMVRCIKNPNLEGDDFLTQVKNAMIPLYKDPKNSIEVYDSELIEEDALLLSPDNAKDFIDAGVLIEMSVTKGKKTKKIWVHGPNGCPNEEALIQSMTQ